MPAIVAAVRSSRQVSSEDPSHVAAIPIDPPPPGLSPTINDLSQLWSTANDGDDVIWQLEKILKLVTHDATDLTAYSFEQIQLELLKSRRNEQRYLGRIYTQFSLTQLIFTKSFG